MQDLVLLHGAIGASAQLIPLADLLRKDYNVYMFDFPGHGGKPGPEGPFSIQKFADDVIRFMDQQELKSAAVFGYSMGGYVGMYLARHYPDRISEIITLATKFQWTEEIAAREIRMLDPGAIREKLPRFAAELEARHAPNDWEKLLQATAALLQDMGQDNPLKTEDFAQISQPAMVLLGDRDKMVGLEETVAVYKALPAGRLGIIPGTGHPVEQADPHMLAFLISRFVSANSSAGSFAR